MTGYSLKTFLSAIFGLLLWTNTFIPKYFEKFSLNINFFLISIIYIFLNLQGNIFSLFNLEIVLAPTLILLPAFFSILDTYFSNFSKIISFILIPIVLLITFATSTNAFFLGMNLGLFIIYFIPILFLIIRKFFKLKIIKISTLIKLTSFISIEKKTYNITKDFVLIVIGTFIFIYFIGLSGFLRITGARELIWLGHIYHTDLFSREINNITSASEIASMFGLTLSLEYYKETYTSIFITNPHSMLIGTLTKFGYIPGIIATIMVFQNIRKISKDVMFSANQYISLIILIIYTLLNGKGFLSINEYSIANYFAFLSIVNSAKIKNKKKELFGEYSKTK